MTAEYIMSTEISPIGVALDPSKSKKSLEYLFQLLIVTKVWVLENGPTIFQKVLLSIISLYV